MACAFASALFGFFSSPFRYASHAGLPRTNCVRPKLCVRIALLVLSSFLDRERPVGHPCRRRLLPFACGPTCRATAGRTRRARPCRARVARCARRGSGSSCSPLLLVLPVLEQRRARNRRTPCHLRRPASSATGDVQHRRIGPCAEPGRGVLVLDVVRGLASLRRPPRPASGWTPPSTFPSRMFFGATSISCFITSSAWTTAGWVVEQPVRP